MADIKLTYFNARGKAELCRYILAQAVVDYQDIRIEREAWKELKPTTPLGQLPMLEVHGKVMSQSVAMARLLAKRLDLTGENDWTAALSDMVVDQVADIFNKIIKIYMEKDEEKKKEATQHFRMESFPGDLAKLEKLLVDCGGKYFTGDNLTWADLSVAQFLHEVQNNMSKDSERLGALADPNFLENYQNLNNLVNNVHNLPNIKKWIETRPKTDF